MIIKLNFSFKTMIFVVLMALFTYSKTSSKLASKSKALPIPEENKVYDKSNPIRSVSFMNRDDIPYTIITLSRGTESNLVNLMRSTKPDDPNSYIIAKDLSDSIKHLPGLKWRISLADIDTNDKRLVFSIQIREGSNIHQTEPFYFDKKAKKFKLLREKSDDIELDTNNIIYICLAAVGVILILILGYIMFFKK